MRWDLEPTLAAIGYVPLDHATPEDSDDQRAHTDTARKARRLVEAAEAFIQDQRW
jgi:hypothetical protein